MKCLRSLGVGSEPWYNSLLMRNREFADLGLLLPGLCGYEREGENDLSFQPGRDKEQLNYLMRLASFIGAAASGHLLGNKKGLHLVVTFKDVNQRDQVAAELDEAIRRG